MKKIILVTGATSGFGKAIALKFAREGNDVIITGRRKELLEDLAKHIITTYNVDVLPLCFDIRKLDEVEKSIKDISLQWKKIDVLVNNAGLAVGMSPIQEGVIDDWERMIDTNVKGLLYITRQIAPLMVANGKGHIINLGSVAGRDVYPNGNVYCATKFAVDALSKAMRIDMLQYGIKVTQIAPGAAETEFSLVRFKGNGEKAKAVYDGYTPLQAEDIADVAYYVTTLPEHVNINDLVIVPTAQANPLFFHKK
ncbi:MAG: SDR family NAD(P)-dependent oxidoreductase [Bacteroidota bacterium]|nr:SDR family NAD(P)-dependent oxidoreductase [Bacteroidota bacterium]